VERRRVLFLDVALDGADLGLCPLHRNFWPEPAHREPVVSRTDRGSRVTERGHRQPQFHLLWICEAGRRGGGLAAVAHRG